MKYTTTPEFWPSDVIEMDDQTARRAKLVQEWLDNILTSDLQGKPNQLSMVVDTRLRLKQYGEATRFTENQFYWLRKIYEDVTGDECHEPYNEEVKDETVKEKGKQDANQNQLKRRNPRLPSGNIGSSLGKESSTRKDKLPGRRNS
jgi:hypothetical protein